MSAGIAGNRLKLLLTTQHNEPEFTHKHHQYITSYTFSRMWVCHRKATRPFSLKHQRCSSSIKCAISKVCLWLLRSNNDVIQFFDWNKRIVFDFVESFVVCMRNDSTKFSTQPLFLVALHSNNSVYLPKQFDIDDTDKHMGGHEEKIHLMSFFRHLCINC